MPYEIKPLTEEFAAEVVGLDLADTLSGGNFEAIRHAWFDAGVMVFRAQRLRPEEQIAFSRRFGPLAIHVMEQFLLPGHPEILLISNKKNADGSPVGFEDAGRYWHSDISYEAEPALGSMLYGIDVPPEGGDTIFANMYRAWDTLDESLKRRVEGRRAFHSYTRNYKSLESAEGSRPDISDDQMARLKDVAHPIVRTVETTGRRALFVNPGFTYAIEGMELSESDFLLEALFAHCTKPEFGYVHAWSAGDLLCWDNRSVIHHATLYDPKYTRHMHRTTIRGGRPV